MSSKESVISKAKQQLRTEKTIARNELSSDQRRELSFLVCKHASEWLKTKDIASLMAYVSFRSELDTNALLTQAWKDQRRVLLPRVIPASGAMSVHMVNAWSELEPGRMVSMNLLYPAKIHKRLKLLHYRMLCLFRGWLLIFREAGLVTAEDTMIDCVRHGRRKSMLLRSPCLDRASLWYAIGSESAHG